jgi:hypothetical protein
MTRTFQPNPFVEIPAILGGRDAPALARRAQIRATNHIDPRCSICGGAFVGDIAAVIEFARIGDIDLAGFDPDDLVCAVDWYAIWGERGGHA